MILPHTLFDKYKVDFPFEEDLVIVHGMNGTYKTKMLEMVHKYCIDQNLPVMYFPAERYLSVTKEQIDSIVVMDSLTKGNTYNRMNPTDDKYFLHDLNFYEYGQWINSGAMQWVNFMTNIALAKPGTICIIDTPERSLHVVIQRHFIECIQRDKNISKLFICTHSPSLIDSFWKSCVESLDCILDLEGNKVFKER